MAAPSWNEFSLPRTLEQDAANSREVRRDPAPAGMIPGASRLRRDLLLEVKPITLQ